MERVPTVLDELLLQAACDEDVMKAEEALKNGANTHARNWTDGSTALHLACSHSNDPKLLALLLRYGADINAKDLDGDTPLYKACLSGHPASAAYLLENGAQVDGDTKDGHTPLYKALQAGHLEIAHLLLERGANVHTVVPEGFTPLWLASQKGSSEIVRMILGKGSADVNVVAFNPERPDTDLGTPLCAAASAGSVLVVRLLIQHQARADIAGKLGNLPLTEAARKGHKEVVKYLLTQSPKLSHVRSALYEAKDSGTKRVSHFLEGWLFAVENGKRNY